MTGDCGAANLNSDDAALAAPLAEINRESVPHFSLKIGCPYLAFVVEDFLMT